MNSLLDALQEGRLIELPALEKARALEVLSLLVEAVPDAGGIDLVNEVNQREREYNTSLGHGVACPHARIPGEGPLLCAVGWSPDGIDYGASDGQKVHLVVLYCIPDSQKSSYLKEVSNLARAITRTGGIHPFENDRDLQSVRGKLLDWVELVIEEGRADSKARMIKLEERAAKPSLVVEKVRITPVSFLLLEGDTFFVLGEDEALTKALESNKDGLALLRRTPVFPWGDFEIHVLNTRHLSGGRLFYDCVAVRTGS